MDLYQQPRQSGGSHTLTMPHRRVKQASGVSQTFDEQTESLLQRLYRGEGEIVGSDGRLYRGRFDLRDIGMNDSVRLPEVAPNGSVTAGGKKVRVAGNSARERALSARSVLNPAAAQIPIEPSLNLPEQDQQPEHDNETVRKPPSPVQS